MRTELEEFELKFIKKNEEIDIQENKYIHPPNACSRPIDNFFYKYWERIEPGLNGFKDKPIAWVDAIEDLTDNMPN